ncbi:MAG: helix-turn-helix transcriptional regulator [Phycisphaerales bacterium]|jgi:transcriptional regulator with XRE-family HTH domain|nr:helix-turn-helix transcriptional regulator [Phycisphaerales bacterium]
MEVKDILARNIRYAREEAELSQKDVSSALGLASHSGVSEMETGQRRISAAELVRLSEILHKSMDWFFDPNASVCNFVAMARAQDQTEELNDVLIETQKYFQHYLLLEKVLKQS